MLEKFNAVRAGLAKWAESVNTMPPLPGHAPQQVTLPDQSAVEYAGFEYSADPQQLRRNIENNLTTQEMLDAGIWHGMYE